MTGCGAPTAGSGLEIEVPSWDDLGGRLDGLRAEIGTAAEAGSADAPSAAAWSVAGRMSRLFRLGSPDAPGLAFVGGTTDPAAYGLDGFPATSVSGRAGDLRSAVLGCVGEAVEALSRLRWGDEVFEHLGSSPPPAMRPDTAGALREGMPDGAGSCCLPAVRLGDEAGTVVPAALCLTMAGTGPPGPSGAGCAAGPSRDHARLAALLELVERDAAALWWLTGRPARPLSAEAVSHVAATLSSLRRDATGRRTWLLDLTTDLEVPCVAAISVGRDGRGFACGLAARLDGAEAARAALQELCQMELANRLVELKLRRDGEPALAAVEQRHRRRMALDGEAAPILFPHGLPRTSPARPPARPSADRQVGVLVETLARQGIECLCVDLTRGAIGVPAVRVLAPMLQGLAGPARSARLDRAAAHPSARADHVLGIALI